jgi:hypothetical protein
MKKPSKKLLIIIPAAVLLTLIVGAIICYITYPKYSITLYSEDKSLSYHLSGMKEFGSLTDYAITIDSHAYIKTAKTNGIIFLPDESIVIMEPDTELRIDVDQTGTYIRQLKGAAFHDVTLQSGKKYKVLTPHMLNQVEGTDFLTYVWDPASNSYIQEAPGGASVWNSGSGTYVNQGRVGTSIDIRGNFNDGYDESNVPEGPLMPIIGSVTVILPNGRSPYDILPDSIDTGAGWSHLDAGGNSAVNRVDGTSTSGSGSSTQSSYANSRREFANQLRQLERDYRAGRITRDEYFNRLRALLNSQAAINALGPMAPTTDNFNDNIDNWNCPYFEANVKPNLQRVLARIYADPENYINLSMIIPRGVEYYDQFVNHVCDDGGLDASEKAYIREVLQAVGAP